MQYVYDLSVGEEVVLRPNDEEVEGFSLMPLHEVQIPIPMKFRNYVSVLVSLF